MLQLPIYIDLEIHQHCCGELDAWVILLRNEKATPKIVGYSPQQIYNFLNEVGLLPRENVLRQVSDVKYVIEPFFFTAEESCCTLYEHDGTVDCYIPKSLASLPPDVRPRKLPRQVKPVIPSGPACSG